MTPEEPTLDDDGAVPLSLDEIEEIWQDRADADVRYDIDQDARDGLRSSSSSSGGHPAAVSEGVTGRADSELPPPGWKDDEVPTWLRTHLMSRLRDMAPTARVIVPCRMIGFAQSHVDVSHDFLEAAFIGERLAVVAPQAAARQVLGKGGRGISIEFTFTIEETLLEPFACELIALARRFGEWSSTWGADLWHLLGIEEIAEFEERLWDLQSELGAGQKVSWHPVFSGLCDDWLLNFLHGVDDLDWDEQDLRRMQPTFADGYIRSFSSATLGAAVLLGREGWIASRDIAPERLFDAYTQGDAPQWRLDPVVDVALAGTRVAVGAQSAVFVPDTRLRRMQRVARHHLRRPSNAPGGSAGCGGESPAPHEYHRSGGTVPRTNEAPDAPSNLLLAENARVLVASDSLASYYVFDEDLRAADSGTLTRIGEGLDTAADAVRLLLGRQHDVTLPWERIEAEAFEQFCYDLIVLEFAPTEVRMMGRTRSRDGGRDILFVVAGMPGRDPVRWIAQCKFTRRTGALGTGDVRDVGDMLDQDGAGGYLLMTNTLIDAGLSDRIEAVTARRGVAFQTRDRLALERRVARFRELRMRYFGQG